MISLFLALGLLAAPPTLQQALEHFDFGQYAEACTLLTPLKTQRGLTRQERIVVLSRLGACHHYQGQIVQARSAFQALLDADPDHALDPVQHPPELLAFFRDIKQSYRPKAAVTGPAVITGPAVTGTPPAAQSGAEVPTPQPKPSAHKSKWVAVAPFGAGQFQNGDAAKGVTLASMETVTLAVGVVGLMLFEAEKESGGFLSGGTFKDPDKANTYQSLYLGGFIGFLGLWAYGAVDALYHFDDGAQITVIPTPNGAALTGRF